MLDGHMCFLYSHHNGRLLHGISFLSTGLSQHTDQTIRYFNDKPMTKEIENDSIKVRPFLRWAGSKRKLLPLLLEAMPGQYDRYVEPFAGSACLYFSINTKSALLGDINSELINTYQQLKTDVDLVIRHLSRFKITEDDYYQIRALDPRRLTKARNAARFIYLNRYCFNGLYRANRDGRFNVPYGGGKSGKLPEPETLRACAAYLNKATLMAGSFEKTLDRVATGDFIYIDPPYSIKARRVFNEYSHFAFGLKQLILLKSYLKQFDKKGIPFLVSYGLSREAQELARGFKYREVVVQRQIAGFAAQRRKNRELLITNY